MPCEDGSREGVSRALGAGAQRGETTHRLGQVAHNDMLLHRRKYDLHLIRVRSAGEVSDNLPPLMPVQCSKLVQHVLLHIGGGVGSLEVGEGVAELGDEEFGGEEVGFVEEEEDARVGEPAGVEGGKEKLVEVEERKERDEPRVGDRVEEGGGFDYSVRRGVLCEQLVVLGDGDDEEEALNVLEAVDPGWARKGSQPRSSKAGNSAIAHHFFLSLLCPPTSKHRNVTLPEILQTASVIPVVLTRERRIS